MSPLSRAVLAERSAALQRHLARVAAKLPADASELQPSSDAADAVILHLWQATQIVIHVAVALCVARDLGAPSAYADAFGRLEAANIIAHDLADRLVRASGFRNVAQAYASLDMARVHRVAVSGPADLRAFIVAVDRALDGSD